MFDPDYPLNRRDIIEAIRLARRCEELHLILTPLLAKYPNQTAMEKAKIYATVQDILSIAMRTVYHFEERHQHNDEESLICSPVTWPYARIIERN